MSDPSEPYRVKLEDVRVITDPSELVALELRNLHKRLDNIEALLIEVRDELRRRKPYQTPTLTERPASGVDFGSPRPGDDNFFCGRCETRIVTPCKSYPDTLQCFCGAYWLQVKPAKEKG